MVPHYFVPNITADPGWTCWTLEIDGEIFGSVLAPASASKDEAWAKFKAQERWEAAFWARVESGDVAGLLRTID